MREWVGGVTKVTNISGPVDQAGTAYTVWFGGVKSRTVVLEAEPPRVFRTEFGNFILRGANPTTFEPDGAGTVIKGEFRTEGVISAIFARIFARGSYRGSFQGELDSFARLAEQEDSTG